MIILRDKYFSSKKKRSSDSDEEDDSLKTTAILGAGAGAVLGADKISKGITKSEYKRATRSMNSTTSDSHVINEKLKSKARQMGVDVVEDPEFSNSAYLGIPISEKLTKKMTPKQKEKLGRLKGLGRKSAGRIGDDVVVMGLGDGNPAVLAHELGHASMSRKGRSHDPFGKAAHSIGGSIAAIPGSLTSSDNKNIRYAATAGFVGAGLRHGLKAAKKEEEGDEKGKKKELRKGAIRSSLLVAPTLVAEGAASRKGLKLLREAGASKETMKNARRTLGHAFGTYAGSAAKPVLLDVGGTAVGYGIGKLRSKKKSNKSKKEED